jgi:serine/threonine-protein kinase RsbW
MPSEIKAVGPLVQRLMRLIEGSHFVAGEEPAIELALEEALNNAVVHGNRMDPEKLVQVLCRCDGKGISLAVKDQGQGFDPNTVPNPLSPENLSADHGRGIWLMRVAMDEVSFENRGTEVHMRKAPPRQPRTEREAPAKYFLSLRQAEPNTAPPLSAWTLHGRLVGLWVSELRRSWKKTHRTDNNRQCIVDLNDVTFIDEKGERLLRSMSKEGVQFIASGIYIKHLLQQRCER